MEYKLLAVDLDGTLFNSQKEIDRETVDALHEYKAQGGKVVICSGRSPLSTRWISETIRLTHPIIAYNGAVIQESNGEIFEQTTFRHQGVLAFVHACEEYRVYGHLYEGDHLLVPEENDWNLSWIENNIPSLELSGGSMEACQRFRSQCEVKLAHPLHDYVSANKPDILKFAAFPKEEGNFKEFTQHLQSLTDEFEVSSSFNFTNLEISPAKTSKASALKKLVSRLGLEMNAVAAIGDNFNDLHMLTSAGLGIAMGNAPEKVKERADAVTESNDQHGVAKAIRRFIL
ncbi:Cof-type HAD-IIB family hydrolase [Bacillus sp. FJAT-27251]|uniref:Cof-type HAD-IIB family hydrolase n=1 Tax=Bacillus sp. FJAT-27251 TaxID=1684142 RepID=UPI0006A759C0|nr:Cof-type HAD-IIB family hydrolase [Bacillus sp. FJAT-27251]